MRNTVIYLDGGQKARHVLRHPSEMRRDVVRLDFALVNDGQLGECLGQFNERLGVHSVRERSDHTVRIDH